MVGIFNFSQKIFFYFKNILEFRTIVKLLKLKIMENFTTFEIKQMVNFVKSQGAVDVKKYIIERAEELNMSAMEAVEELVASAVDLYIDRNFNNQ